MKKQLPVTPVQKEQPDKNSQKDREKQIDLILKKQAEYDVLRPAGSRKFRNWSDAISVSSIQSRLWL